MKAFGLSFRPSENQLLICDNSGIIQYSDGDPEETKLLRTINSVNDLSSTSWELQSVINSWAQRYHLSIHRGAIVRCLPLAADSRVFELGAGCGAVTRALGEKFAAADAVEGSAVRARICASRCRDLPNVRVFAADINNIRPQPDYDVVFLVGVLEWSKGYLHFENPFRFCLQIASRALKRGGVLVIAIENQVGLKYLLGIGEDHSGIELEGLQGYPTFRQAETFSKAKLLELLNSVGLNAARFLYPFPDYKLARVILTDEAVSLRCQPIAYWASRYPFEDYLRPERRITGHQALITSEITKAGLLGELSNSFLIMACAQDSSLPDIPWVVWSERLTRHKLYTSQTRLEFSNKALIVKKQYPHAFVEKYSNVKPFRLNLVESEPFFDGSILDLEMVRMAMAGDKEQFFQVLERWMAYTRNCLLAADRLHLLPQDWDCIPRNLMEMKDGTLRAFDLEFFYDDLFSSQDLCARGLLWWYIDNFAWVAPLNPTGRTVRDHLICTLTKLFPTHNADMLIAKAIEREHRFQTLLDFTDATFIDQMLNQTPKHFRNPTQRLSDAEAELQTTKAQLRRLKNHVIVGRVISTWRKLFNPTLP